MERLIKTGQIKPKNTKDIKDSRIGLGMEKLDRDAFDPSKVYDKVAALGVKWIRIQSGWQKTEKVKGVYDFSWLDEQVDNLLNRGLKPWLCLCYGNILYDELAKEYIGAVGCPPIRTEEAYNAWLSYVKAIAKHFKGRVEYYEIWNEADGGWTWRPVPDMKEYSEFCIKTGNAVKSADNNAKIITGSHYSDTMTFAMEDLFLGTDKISDAISYHNYNYNERMSMQKAIALKDLAKSFGKDIEIIQGESGSQSQSGGNGALNWIRTDQNMQTKEMMRHIMADLLAGVKFSSTFSCVDMAENLDAKEGEPITTCGYFGMLGAEFDSKTGNLVGDYYEKPSYYALQNLCSIFDENVNPVNIPNLFVPKASSRINGFDCKTTDLIYGGFEKKDGTRAFVYWNSTDIITVKEYEGSISFELAGVKGDAKLIDPMDGSVYEIPESILTKTEYGLYIFKNFPVKDYPLIIAFGNFYKE